MQAVKNDPAIGWTAANALGAIDADGASTPALIEALGNEDAALRRFAAYGLSRLGRKGGAAEQALHKALRDRDSAARIGAAAAYWSVSGKADEPVQVLRSVLRAPDGWTAQMWAANALADIGPAAKAAVPELVACLSSNTRYVVTSCAKALGKIGPDAGAAALALTSRMAGSDDDYARVCIA